MQIFTGVITFTFSMVLGVQSANLISWAADIIIPLPGNILVAEDRDFLPEDSIRPQGIKVMYAGIKHVPDDPSPYIRIIIYNGTSGPLAYGAKGAGYAFPNVRVNAVEAPEVYRCGSGTSLYKIASGSSAEFLVGVYEFTKEPGKDDQVTVGFWLRMENRETSDGFVSEPFTLPGEFRTAVRARSQLEQGSF